MFPLFCCCGGRPLGVPFLFIYIRGNKKPQRIAGVFRSTKRERAMNRLLKCVYLGFAVVVVFFLFGLF